MAWTLQVGGQLIGTELLFEVPTIERISRPIAEPGFGHERALVIDPAANLLYRVRFVIYHETADAWTFQRWLLTTARLLAKGRQDVTVYDDGTLKLTYPQCAFESFARPRPRSAPEAFFSAAIEATFTTDQEPF